MRLIWDASILSMYPLGKSGFRGGTEVMIERICHLLAEKGHTVHVITRDLEQEEQRGPTEWWWPQGSHPSHADVLVETQQVLEEHLCQYEAEKVVLAHTGCDPYLGPNNQWATQIDAWPVFCETHGKMLQEQRPSIPADRVFVTGLGIDVDDYPWPVSWLPNPNYVYKGVVKVPGRLLYANDPMRGLFSLLDIFDHVKRKVPDASLHVTYDFDRQAAIHQWEHTYKAQLTLDMKKRLETTPGVISLGAISREEFVRDQLECQVHCMPSDPPNIGTQTWGITQMECAAAGAALVLSDVEAFPEVFGEAATVLPVIGYFISDQGRRVDAQDYASVVAELMRNPAKWQEASRKARALAEQNTWERVADNWDKMLSAIMAPERELVSA